MTPASATSKLAAAVDESADLLQALGACFVTLNQQGQLRGCIGSLLARRTLLTDVKATVAVTAGYMHDQPRRDFYAKMDAANVDPKAFTEDFYFKLTSAHLQPVLDTLVYIKHDTDVWLEITTLLIPGHNDSSAEITALSQWVMKELGPDVPLHFSAFHPDYKMPDVPATPATTLLRARTLALQEGLHHVYTGNVHHIEGDTTFCPHCQTQLIVRDWYQIKHYRLTAAGACPDCGVALAGRFDAQAGHFGRRRCSISIAT